MQQKALSSHSLIEINASPDRKQSVSQFESSGPSVTKLAVSEYVYVDKCPGYEAYAGFDHIWDMTKDFRYLIITQLLISVCVHMLSF